MINKSKIAVNLIYILTTFSRNFLAKKMSISSRNSHYEIIIFSAVSLILYSKIVLKSTNQKKNNYSFVHLLIFKLFFFVSTVLLFKNITKVSALQNGVLLQSKSVVVFLLSYLFLNKKFKASEVLGVLLIIFGIIGCKFFSAGDDTKILLENKFMLILSGVFSGLAACYFDYTSKDKTNSPIRLIYDANILYFLLAFMFFLWKIFVENLPSQLFKMHVFVLSICSFFEILAGIYNSYWFTALERLVLGMVVKMVSNILIDFLIDFKICMISLLFYLISTIGILVYHLDIVKDFFKKETESGTREEV